MKTMVPLFRDRKWGSSALVTLMVPKTFVSNCVSHCSCSSSSTVPIWIKPALLMRTSMWPCMDMAWDKVAFIEDCSEVTSSWRMETPVCSRLVIFESERAVAMTLSPRARIWGMNCAPRPEEQPVMSQTRGAIMRRK